MQCPVCKLENPDDAMRCDCGYDFVHHSDAFADKDYRKKLAKAEKEGPVSRFGLASSMIKFFWRF
jgi:hypothetical protein